MSSYDCTSLVSILVCQSTGFSLYTSFSQFQLRHWLLYYFQSVHWFQLCYWLHSLYWSMCTLWFSVFAGLSRFIPGPSHDADSILALVSIVAQVPMPSVVFALVTVPVLAAVLEIIAVPVLSGGLCTRAVCGAAVGLENVSSGGGSGEAAPGVPGNAGRTPRG